MRRTSPLRARELIHSNSTIFIILSAIFLLGMFYGALTYKADVEMNIGKLSIITNEFRLDNQGWSILSRFSSSLFSNLLLIFIPYLMGYWAISQPIILFIPFFKGLGLGYYMTYCYQCYKIKAIFYCLLIIIPYTIIALFAIIISCREALRLSSMFFSTITQNGANNLNVKAIKLYNIKFLVLCVICLISSLVNVLTYFMFSRFFAF